MNRLFFIAILTIILIGLLLFGLSYTSTFIDNTGILENERTSSISKSGNSPASATITIMMYAVTNESIIEI